MNTQAEQIKKAKATYLIWLNNPRDGMSTQRAAVYLLTDKLGILWPSDSSAGAKSKELLPHQRYSKLKQYPAYHFALGGCGYSKRQELEEVLRKHNPKITLSVLSGWSPSSSF